MNRELVMNYPVDSATMGEVLDVLNGYIQSGQPHQVAVVNAAKFWRMEKDACLDHIVRQCALILPEKAVVMGGNFLGKPIKEPILGVTLFKRLLELGDQKHYHVYFLGAKKYVVQELVNTVWKKFPGLQIAGFHDGYFDEEEERKLILQIQLVKPDILFVAMGTPKQEYWISKHLKTLNVPVCLGLGGSFDVVAGLKQDAPEWVRSLAMEWLYRTLQDPKNLWRRYAVTIPWYLGRLLSHKLNSLKSNS